MLVIDPVFCFVLTVFCLQDSVEVYALARFLLSLLEVLDLCFPLSVDNSRFDKSDYPLSASLAFRLGLTLLNSVHYRSANI